MKDLKKELVCISCPIGCHLKVTVKQGNITVSGNTCNRGEMYGKEEVSSPKRIVTAVVKIKGQEHVFIPIKTDKPLLKKHINPLLKKLYSIEAAAPIKRGDILIKNFQNTEVNVVFTRSLNHSYIN